MDYSTTWFAVEYRGADQGTDLSGYTQIFDCREGDGTPNSYVAQGSTVYILSLCCIPKTNIINICQLYFNFKKIEETSVLV